MTEKEAREIYRAGEEAVVLTLLALSAEIQLLKERVALIEKNSTNSSKPPSSDSPKDRSVREQKKEKRSRKAGGQIGHKGVKRALKPIEEVDKVIKCYSKVCLLCKLFKECKEKKEVAVERFQQTELPTLSPLTTEFQLISLKGKCGGTHKGILPVEVESSAFGPRLASLLAYFTAVLHVPRRKLKDSFKLLFGVDISLGSTQNLLEEVSDSLEYGYNELEEALPSNPVLNIDETGWYKKSWLWVFVTTTFVFFHVAKKRTAEVLENVLGYAYQGILCVDRWGAYTKYYKGLMQMCWAHLKRDIEAVRELGVKMKLKFTIQFAEGFDKLRKKIFRLWHRFKTGLIDRASLIKKTANLRLKIEAWLFKHTTSPYKRLNAFAKRLYKRKAHLFTFIFHEGVEPTNNISERNLRPAVQWKKICFGNRSDDGAALTSRLLTAVHTCLLKGMNALEFIVDTLTCYRKNLPTPSLLNP